MRKKFTGALSNGSLQPGIIELFRKAGMPIPQPTRKYRVCIEHTLVSEIIWMRPQLVPLAISEGVADFGITGQDCYREYLMGDPDSRGLTRVDNRFLFSRNGGRLKICLVGRGDTKPARSAKIFSEFPLTTKGLYPLAKVIPAVGSVEALVPKPFEFGVTTVDSGESLEQNGLQVIEVLFDWPDCSPQLYAQMGRTASFYLAMLELSNLLHGGR